MMVLKFLGTLILFGVIFCVVGIFLLLIIDLVKNIFN